MNLDTGIQLIQRQRVAQGMWIVVTCVIVGLLYPLLDREFGNPLAFVNGGLIGLLGGMAIAMHDDYSSYRTLRRQRFVFRLIKLTLLYTLFFAVTVAAVIGIVYGVESELSLIEYLRSENYISFLRRGDYKSIVAYSLILCGIVSFSLSLRRKVEGQMLRNMISGKYRNPKHEQRILMAIDLSGSTSIAERMGQKEYFRFINEFFFDLTPAILATNARIYRYVGDQVTVSWLVRSEQANTEALRTYFYARNLMRKQSEKYFNRWGLAPKFRATFHCGQIIVAEIGEVKSQLVFHGQPMFDLARMEKAGGKLGLPLIVSEDMRMIVNLPEFYEVEKCGEIEAHAGGKVQLHTVHTKTPKRRA